MTPLRLYNTLTRRKEVFEPLEPGRVRVYSCGPTVYSRQHVGARGARERPLGLGRRPEVDSHPAG